MRTRHVWMLLPALIGLDAAAAARGSRAAAAASTVLLVFGWAALEGLVWGAAVWIKPFVFAPGFACWMVGFLQVRQVRPGRGRLLAADAGGLLAGGLLAGALGLLWLWQSGSWPYFWDIFLGWNRDYAAFINHVRVPLWIEFLVQYLPWSIVPVAAAYLAVKAVKREVVDSTPTAPRCALLAAFFLGWLFQALFLQLPHDYPIVPALIPGVALIAACWRPRKPAALLGLTAWLCLIALTALVWSANFRLDRIGRWAECCREGPTPRIQSLLTTRKDNPNCPDPEPLAAVAAYLRGQGVRDGEVTCISGCTHPLYLTLVRRLLHASLKSKWRACSLRSIGKKYWPR